MRSRRTRLAVHLLEARDVPAGNVAATLAGGVLTLTGDDAGNEFTLRVTAADATLTPDATTAVNGGAPGTPVTLPGAAASVRATMKGGFDRVEIDRTEDFALSGAAAFDLGDGGGSLDLVTAGTIQLGSLTVRAGDGSDSVTVRGGAGLGSTVAGPATFSYAVGGSLTLVENIAFSGLTGVTVAGGEGDDRVLLQAVQVAGAVTAVLGNSDNSVTVSDSRVGSLLATGYEVLSALQNTTVIGGVTYRATTGVQVNFDSVTVGGGAVVGSARSTAHAGWRGTSAVGGVAVAGDTATMELFSGAKVAVARDVALAARNGNAVFSLEQAELTARNLAARSLREEAEVRISQSRLAARNLIVTGAQATYDQIGASSELSLTGNLTTTATSGSAECRQQGTATVGGGLTVLGSSIVNLFQPLPDTTMTVGGKLTALADRVIVTMAGTLTVTGDTAMTGVSRTSVVLRMAAGSEFRGNVTVQGGVEDDQFETTANARFLKNLTVAQGNGRGEVTILGTTGTPTVGGALTIATGAGNDNVTLQGVSVTGPTKITTGAGADTLTIDSTAFAGAFFADLGTGDDTISIAQNAGALGPVTFTGKATFQAGNGNDTLRLGRAVASGGDANSRVRFQAAGNRIDGGLALNAFDDETQQVELVGGATLATPNWTDPTP